MMNLYQPGERVSALNMNRPHIEALTQSGYAADGSDFAGYARRTNVYTKAEMQAPTFQVVQTVAFTDASPSVSGGGLNGVQRFANMTNNSVQTRQLRASYGEATWEGSGLSLMSVVHGGIYNAATGASFTGRVLSVTGVVGIGFKVESAGGIIDELSGGGFFAVAKGGGTVTALRGITATVKTINGLVNGNTAIGSVAGVYVSRGILTPETIVSGDYCGIFIEDPALGGGVVNGTRYALYAVGGNINLQAGALQVAGLQVVGARAAGWTSGTGTPNKGAFAADTATAAQAAQRTLAIEQALRTHGLLN